MTAAIDTSRAPRSDLMLARLGVPPDAAKVLIFGESSHWDPNWLRTADEYFEDQIVPVMRAVLSELAADPKRVFAIESTFFLERFWQNHPEHRDTLKALLVQRRLRLTGTGITTPDTVIPNPEAILRDYVLGDRWLRSIGIEVDQKLAYLPDDFGYSPGLPSLLAELGFDYAAISRIDGAHFIGSDYRPATAFPLPGSSAELLQNKLRSADFVWVAPDGREVLCHWNPFTYFQGDMLAYVGIIRWMGRTYGMPWRTGRHIANRVAAYVDALSSVARTKFLFCPIGCDFNPPIPDLGFLLDRYNREIYPDTGVWLLSAGLDDYMQLVDTQRDALPRLALDINPYWMGFYATRPEAKVRHHRVTRKLLSAESDDVDRRLTGAAREPGFEALSRQVWSDLAFANHHDFITGTSPDRVWRREQAPLLRNAEAAIDRILPAGTPSVGAATSPGIGLRRVGHRITVETACAQLVFDEDAGGCLVEWRDARGPRIVGPSLDLGLYRDSGGLWRLGHEFIGGRFGRIERGQDHPACLRATVYDGRVVLVSSTRFGGRIVQRTFHVYEHRPEIVVEVRGALPLGTSMCLEVASGLTTKEVGMDVPGGFVRRPWRKLFDPTFWPAFSVAHVADKDLGIAAFFAGPASVSLDEAGRLSAMVQRNAPKEMAFGVLPVLAHPARGTDPGYPVTCVFTPTDGESTRSIDLCRRAQGLLTDLALFGPALAQSRRRSRALAVHGDAYLVALKVAEDRRGVVARLVGEPGASVRVEGTVAPIARLTRCDALERDRYAISVEAGAGRVVLDGSTVTLRVEF